MRILFTLITLFLSVVFAFGAAKDDLRGIKKAITKQKQQISKTRKVESKVSAELQTIQNSLKQKEVSLQN